MKIVPARKNELTTKRKMGLALEIAQSLTGRRKILCHACLQFTTTINSGCSYCNAKRLGRS